MADDLNFPYYDEDDDQTPKQAIASIMAPADAASLVQPQLQPAAAPAPPDIAPSTAALNRVTLPTYDADKVQRLRDAARSDSMPINPMQAQYQPSTKMKVLRGLAAAFTGGIPAVLNPGTYTAPNRAYQVADAQRQARQSNDVADLDAYQKGFEDQNQAAERGIGLGTALGTAELNSAKAQENKDKGDRYDNAVDPNSMAPDDPENPGGTWHGKTYGGAASTGLAPPKAYASAVTGPAVVAGRSAMADKVGLKGQQRIQYILTGKMDLKQGGGGGGTGLPSAGGAGATTLPDGTADLSKVPASIRETVRQIGEGRVPAPRRTKQNAAILDAVANAYPDYDASMYPTYAKTRQAFTTGTQSIGINAFNTALAHLGRAEQNAPHNGSIPALNAVGNALSRASGSSKLTAFDADRVAVSSEIAKAYKGGVINKEEHDEFQNLLSPNASPAQMKANFSELKRLLTGKLNAYSKEWTDGMPKGSVKPFSVMSPEATAVMNEGQSAAQSPQTSSSLGGTLPSQAASQLQEGVQHTFNNGQTWTLRKGQPVRIK